MVDKVLKTSFDASTFGGEMTRQANQIASDLGMKAGGETDSFRHAYVAAKIAERFEFPPFTGDDMARAGGVANELNALETNTFQEHASDLRNNEMGMSIRRQVLEDVDELRIEFRLDRVETKRLYERMLRLRIAQGVRDGSINQNPFKESASPSKSSPKNGGDVFVHPYEQKDGPVKAHYRSRP